MALYMSGSSIGDQLSGDNYSRQVDEIRPKVFMEEWLACLTELDIPKDNPA